jgi:hypothetical protein
MEINKFSGEQEGGNNFPLESIAKLENLAMLRSNLSLEEDKKEYIFEKISHDVEQIVAGLFAEYSGIGNCLRVTLDDEGFLLSNHSLRSPLQNIKDIEAGINHKKTETFKINNEDKKQVFKELNLLRIVSDYEDKLETFGGCAVWRGGDDLYFTNDPDLISEVIDSQSKRIEEKIEDAKRLIDELKEIANNLEAMQGPLAYYRKNYTKPEEHNEIDVGLAIQKGKISPESH